MHPRRGARFAHLKLLAQIIPSAFYVSALRSDNKSNYQHFVGVFEYGASARVERVRPLWPNTKYEDSMQALENK